MSENSDSTDEDETSRLLQIQSDLQAYLRRLEIRKSSLQAQIRTTSNKFEEINKKRAKIQFSRHELNRLSSKEFLDPAEAKRLKDISELGERRKVHIAKCEELTNMLKEARADSKKVREEIVKVANILLQITSILNNDECNKVIPKEIMDFFIVYQTNPHRYF